MNRYMAGAAVFETALTPGIVIAGAVVPVPRYLPGVRRLLSQLRSEAVRLPFERRQHLTGQPPTTPACVWFRNRAIHLHLAPEGMGLLYARS